MFSVTGSEGALVQMISHGFVSAAMFLCVGVLYDRMHTHAIADFGGVANTMPKFAAFVMLFSMANAGLPGTSGFVGSHPSIAQEEPIPCLPCCGSALPTMMSEASP